MSNNVLISNDIIATAEDIISTSGPILIVGDIGTGKDTLAFYLHEKILQRSANRFFKVDCSYSKVELERGLLGYIDSYRGEFDDGRYKPGFLEQAVEGTVYLDRLHLANKGNIDFLGDILKGKPYKPVGEKIASREVGNVYFMASCEPHPYEGETGYLSPFFKDIFRGRIIVLPKLKNIPNDLEKYFNLFIQDELSNSDFNLDDKAKAILCDLPNNLSGLRTIARRIVNIYPQNKVITCEFLNQQILSNNMFGPLESVRKHRCQSLSNNVVYQGKPVTGEMIYSWINQFESFRGISDIDPRDIAESLIRNAIGKYYYDRQRIDEIVKKLYEELLDNIKHEIKNDRKIIPDPKFTHAERIITHHLKAAQEELIYTQMLGIMRSPETLSNSLRIVSKIRPKNNAIEFQNLPTLIKNKKGHIRIVLLDDFLGSGHQVVKDIIGQIQSAQSLRNAVISTNAKITFYLLICVGFDIGKQYVENSLKNNKWFNFNLIIGDLLNDQDRAFQESSLIFGQKEIRQEAVDLIVRRIGERLCNTNKGENPRGWNDIESLVVFETNVPNDTLPVIWKSNNVGENGWRAIFPRLLVG